MGGRRDAPSNRHLSEEDRWGIILTWKKLNSIRATALELGYNREVVARWVHSPDLNLIENFWNIIQMEVQK
jgi:hypothetical protein